jgi:hypothetical protein
MTYVLIESALLYSAIASLATFAMGFSLGFRWREDRKPHRRGMRVESPHAPWSYGSFEQHENRFKRKQNTDSKKQ